jgi:DNA modification methylase
MIELNKIYNADCLEKMKNIPDGSVDAIITDLPYEVLHKNNPHAQWDRIIPFEPLWEQYERIIKGNGAIVLFAQGMFTAQLMMSNPKLWRYNLIWDKCRVTGFLNANRMPMRCHEDICVFYKSLPTYNPQMEEGKPNHSQGNGQHKETNRCYGEYKTGRTYDYNTKSGIAKVEPTRPNEKFPQSIIRIPKEHETTVYHPTQKPVELIRYLIRTYTNEGETVLDSCCGSGTTAIAAIREKRNFICIEKSEEYFNIAKKRIENELNQPTLF